MGGKTGQRGVTVTPDNTIQIAFTWNGKACRERLKLKPTEANIKYAARLRASIVSEIERGTFDYARHFPDSPRAGKRTLTVGKALDDYLLWAERSVAFSTYKDYGSAIRYHLRPRFGDTPINQLTVSDLKAWAGSLTISAKRINNVLIPLRHVMADAHSEGLIDTNPMDRLPQLSDRRKKPEPDPFTFEEADKLVAAAKEEVFAHFITFACWTGMRTSELLALRWEDVDWHNGLVRVQRVRVKGMLEEATKTVSGRRDVRLLGPAREALEAMRAHTQAKGAEIFVHPVHRRPWRSDLEVRKVWWPTIRASGIRYRPQYQTRHTYASWMLSAGEDPAWVANQMGHKDWAMIRKVYARWIPSMRPDAGQKAEALFAGFSQDSDESKAGKG